MVLLATTSLASNKVLNISLFLFDLSSISPESFDIDWLVPETSKSELVCSSIATLKLSLDAKTVVEISAIFLNKFNNF